MIGQWISPAIVIHLHKAPIPEDEPLPGEEPMPLEDPVPDPHPVTGRDES
ncbi:MAG: hypothetical protein H7315_04795 [Herminiimonas sp.]|nr:hypothetical protein [Herminiimonas sp.]